MEDYDSPRLRRRTRNKYTGYLEQERGTVYKEPGGRIRIGLIWPGPYETGQSSLGFLSVYSLINVQPRVYAERIFQPEPGQAPLSLETQSPLEAFDLLAASLTLENDYWIFLDILIKGRINPDRADRRGEPMVFAGGVGVWSNPWPVIPFLDLIMLGEAEIQWPQIVEHYLDVSFALTPKAGKLKILSEKVPGVLIPSLWPEEVLKGEAPLAEPVRPAVLKWPPKGYYPPVSPIVTPNTELGERRLVEISRGCPYGCRFCLAGVLYRPHRPWPKSKIIYVLGRPRLKNDMVGLVSPAVADHPEIESLLEILASQNREVSVSSLRLSSLTENLTRRLLAAGVKGLAVAPEAGSQRLRDSINKTLNEEEILGSCRLLSEGGLRRLKLYFMLGLPGETDEDIRSIAELCRKIKKAVQTKSFAPKLILSVANFTPKPQTPFEFVPMLTESELKRRGQILREAAVKVGGLELKLDPPIWSVVQGMLARGGAEASNLVRCLQAEHGRCRPAFRRFRAAYSEDHRHRDYERYLFSENWPRDRYKPWRVVAVSAGPDFLENEYRRSLADAVSPACPPGLACGCCGSCGFSRKND
ncbi:MAG: radical SAM protein [Deltaproteobacteria bacterium]|nr:radical SAM protein [Deltaproteobacteria bacterium]